MNAEQMETALRAQQAALDRIVGENAELMNRSQLAEQAVQGLRQELQQGRQPLQEMASVAESLKEIVTKLSEEKKSEKLVDTKGVAKPVVFKNDEGKFKEWYIKTVGYMIAAFGKDFRQFFEWVEDQEVPLTDAMLVAQFEAEQLGDGVAPPAEPKLTDVLEKSGQVYALLQSLTEGESFDLVTGAGAGNGAEAVRRLVRRWDPSCGGSKTCSLEAGDHAEQEQFG